MRNVVLFLLFSIIFLLGCKMEPSVNGESFSNPFISEEFDLVTTSFNINTFNSQRSAWEERDYKCYSYVLALGTGRNGQDNFSDPFDIYRAEITVEKGKVPAIINLEGERPGNIPSEYNISGIYDYISSVIKDLTSQIENTNEEFRVNITYSLIDDIPHEVSIERKENGAYRGFFLIRIESFLRGSEITDEILSEVSK